MRLYQYHCAVAFATAGIIIFIVPILFFAIGEPIKNWVIRKEIDRYFKSWCQSSSLIPKSTFAQTRDKIVQENQAGSGISFRTSKNPKLIIASCSIAFMIMLFMFVCGHIIISQVQLSLADVWAECLLYVSTFVCVEVAIIVLLFSKYCVIDIAMVNKYIVEKVLF